MCDEEVWVGKKPGGRMNRGTTSSSDSEGDDLLMS